MRKQRRMQEEKKRKEDIMKGKRKMNTAGQCLEMLLVFLLAFAGTLAFLIADERCARISSQPSAAERVSKATEQFMQRSSTYSDHINE